MKLSERTHLGQVRVLRKTAEDVLKIYGKQASLKFINHGENTTFCAVGDHKYLVRIHRPGYQSPANIRSELMWLKALRDAGISAPEPICTLDGEAIASVDVEGDQTRVAAMFKWVEGAMLGERVSAQRLRAMGRTIAMLHSHASAFVPPQGFERKRLNRSGLFGQMMGGGRHQVFGDDRTLFEDVEGKLTELIKKLGEGPDVFGLIHADLHYGNMVFPPGNSKSPVAIPIDFDDSAYGYFAYDLAVMLAPLARKFPQINTRKLIFEGYREILELPNSIEDTIGDFIVARMLTITYWVLSRTDNPVFVARVPEQLERARAVFSDYLK